MQISGTRSNSATLTRTLSEQKSETFGLTRTFASGLRPFTPMNFDVTRTYRSNMLGYEWADILQGDFGIVDNINQNFTASYAPVIFRWLTHDVNYTTNYQWSWGSGYAESGKTVSSNTTISTSWNLKTTQLFRKPTPRGGGRGTTRSPAPGGKAPPEKETESKKEGASEKPPNPLTLLKSIASKLNDIRFDYNFKRDLNTPGVTGEADWKYQLGLSTNPGIGQISSPTLSLRGSASYSNDYQVKSGLDLLQNLKTNFDYSYRATENFGNTVSGQYARSQFYIFSSKDGKVKHFPFVNLNARLTGLEKAPFFAKIAQTVSVESGFTGKSTTDWNTDKSNITKHSYERNFSPLLGVNITWNGGVSSNFQLKKTQSLTDMLQADQKSRSSNTTISLTANYNRKSGFRIPIPVWPFKNKEFKNNTTFSLTFSASARKEEMLSGNATKFNTTSTNSQWSLMPKIDYTFSNSVTGGIHYETGVTKNSATGKTSFHEFGFNVNIQIRGR
jgi:hypothetical protein